MVSFYCVGCPVALSNNKKFKKKACRSCLATDDGCEKIIKRVELLAEQARKNMDQAVIDLLDKHNKELNG